MRLPRIALAGLAVAAIAGAQVRLSGRVVDENEAPVADARVSAQRGTEKPIETGSSPAGTFELTLSAPGRYLVSVNRTGYFELENREVDVQPGGTMVTLVLTAQREVFQSVTVGELPSPIDPEQTEREQHLSGTEINNVPYPAANSLRNSMKLSPGVVQDPAGGVHFHGGSEDQTQYLLDGFDISNPIDGRFSTRLAVEGVRSMDLVSSRELPQFGRGSAGSLDIRPENGTDHFHYTATNFIPGIDFHSGARFGDWTPRAGITGPLLKSRAWFSASVDAEYNSGFVSGIASGPNTNPAWALSNLFHAQGNLTPSQILYADLLTTYDHQGRYGLGVLDPAETTSTVSDNQWLAAVKDSYSWREGNMVEIGFAWQRTFRSNVPQGTSLYLLTPEGRSGNYFVHSRQDGRRTQIFANYFPRRRQLAGAHQLQAGVEFERLTYAAQFRRSGYEQIGLSGLPLSETTFQGSGDFGLPNKTVAAYVNDHWQPAKRLTADIGLRLDWDELVDRAAWSPRISLAYAPWANDSTKLSAGYAVVHDPTYLAVFARPLDQSAVTVFYSPAGVPGTPVVSTFVTGQNLRLPRYRKVSAGIERDFGHRFSASAEWLRKRGRDGFVYAPEGGGPINVQSLALSYGTGGTYALSNLRRDSYDEIALTARHSFGDQYEWMASYVHSRAVSNAVLDVSVDQPLSVLNNSGPMPWDAPNRLMGWGYLPIPFLGKNWAIAGLADWRTGFPFSVTNDAGEVTGAVNSYRYPNNFDLNVHIERRFVFAGYRLAVRVGANNLTGQHNYTAVNNVIGSPNYLQFYGDEGRHFVVRLRVFGKASSSP